MPETPGCASTIGEIALPSLVSPVSKRAVEVRRFSRDGKVLHPPIRAAPRQRAKMYGATTVRTFIAPLGMTSSVAALDSRPLCVENIPARPRYCFRTDAYPCEGLRIVRHKGLVGSLDDLAQLTVAALVRIGHEHDLVLDQYDSLNDFQQGVIFGHRLKRILPNGLFDHGCTEEQCDIFGH